MPPACSGGCWRHSWFELELEKGARTGRARERRRSTAGPPRCRHSCLRARPGPPPPTRRARTARQDTTRQNRHVVRTTPATHRSTSGATPPHSLTPSLTLVSPANLTTPFLPVEPTTTVAPTAMLPLLLLLLDIAPCSVLCCAVLCCAVLCCAVLCDEDCES